MGVLIRKPNGCNRLLVKVALFMLCVGSHFQLDSMRNRLPFLILAVYIHSHVNFNPKFWLPLWNNDIRERLSFFLHFDLFLKVGDLVDLWHNIYDTIQLKFITLMFN